MNKMKTAFDIVTLTRDHTCPVCGSRDIRYEGVCEASETRLVKRYRCADCNRLLTLTYLIEGKAHVEDDEALDDAPLLTYGLDTGLLVTDDYVRNRVHDDPPETDDELDDDELDSDDIDDYADRLIAYLHEGNRLHDRLAETLWDTSHESSRLQETIDNVIWALRDEFDETNA